MEKIQAYESFRDYIIRIGKLTLLIAVPFSFVPPLLVSIMYGAWPESSAIVAGLKNIIACWFVLWLIEPLCYFPLLNVAGTYNAWLSGNIVNLRVPCAAVAQQAADVVEGTQEGEVVATLGLCASVFVNIVVLCFFAAAGSQFLKVIPALVATSFKYTLPAVMGGMIVSFAVRNFKVGIVALCIALAVYFSGIKGGADLLLMIFPTIIISIWMYKKHWI